MSPPPVADWLVVTLIEDDGVTKIPLLSVVVPAYENSEGPFPDVPSVTI